MYKPDDKNIDRLSRDAAEHYHAPGEPAWDALQQILDKELPQEKEKKRRGFFFFFFLLLGLSVAGTGIWWGATINNKNKNTHTTAAASDNNHANRIAGQPAEPGDITSSKEKQADVSEDYSAPVNTTPAANISKKPIPDKVANKQSLNVNATTSAIDKITSNKTKIKVISLVPVDFVKNNGTPQRNYNGKTNTAIAEEKGKHAFISAQKIKGNTHFNSAEVTKSNNRPITTGSLPNNTSIENIADKTPTNSIAKKGKQNKGQKLKQTATGQDADNDNSADIATSNNINDKTVSETAAGDKAIEKPATTPEDTIAHKLTSLKPAITEPAKIQPAKKDSAVAIKKKAKSKNEKAINIGLTAGFDYSTVKFTHGDNAGYNFGIMGGYQFSRHWSVYTGVIYTKKNYELNGADYHPPKHYWTQYVDLQTVEGYCRMWEVPLLARYTFNPGSKTAFFASTGLSSYFMKKQDYTYSFKNMGVPGTAAWSNDSTFNHVFSILHLSAGFEKKIGKHMNWQIEPYAKIPLGGVGFGNIRLSSFGINFTVQYRQPVKR